MTVEQERLKTLQTNTTLMQECAALESGRQLRANCREMRRLAEIIDLAANQTALEDFNMKHDLPADWIAGLLEKATNATARLEEMNGNSTLVAACEADTQSLASKLNIVWDYYISRLLHISTGLKNIPFGYKHIQIKIVQSLIPPRKPQYVEKPTSSSARGCLVNMITASSQGMIAEAKNAAPSTMAVGGVTLAAAMIVAICTTF
jgi:hypothetical protein